MTHKHETPIEIHWQLLAFYGEDTVDIRIVHHWVRKSRDSGRNLDPNDQLWSKRPVSATHYLNRQEADRLIKKNQRISLTAMAEKLNIGVSSVSETVAGLGHKKRW